MLEKPLGPITLGSSPALYAAVRAALHVEQEAGTIPDRSAPQDDDLVLWVGPKRHPIAFATIVSAATALADRLWLDLLWVAPEHRRQGYGETLLGCVIYLARQRGALLQLGTGMSNKPMLALAKKLGLKRVAFILERDCG